MTKRREYTSVVALLGLLFLSDYSNYRYFHNKTEFYVRKYGHLQSFLFEQKTPEEQKAENKREQLKELEDLYVVKK